MPVISFPQTKFSPVDESLARDKIFNPKPDTPLVIEVGFQTCIRAVKEYVGLMLHGYDVTLVTHFQNIPEAFNLVGTPMIYWDVSQLQRCLRSATRSGRMQGKKVIVHCHNEPNWLIWEAYKAFTDEERPKIVFDAHDLNSARSGMLLDDEIEAVKRSDAMVHVSQPILEHTNMIHNYTKPSAVVLSATPSVFFKDKPSNERSGIVYEGGICAPNTSYATRNPYRDLSVPVKQLVAKDMDVTLFFPPEKQIMDYYLSIGADCKGFLGYFPLLETMANFKYGLCFYPNVIEPQRHRQITWGMYNKIFDCMASGCVLIGGKGTESGNFITKYKIGIVVEDMSEFTPLSDDEYEEYHQNVLRVRQQFSMENEVLKLIAMYNLLW